MKRKLELVIEGTCEKCPYAQTDHSELAYYCCHPAMAERDWTDRDDYIARIEGVDCVAAFPPILTNCPLPEVE